MQLSWEFDTWLFGLDQISLQQLLLLPENEVLNHIVFVPIFMLSEFELQPSGVEIKKRVHIASLFINNLGFVAF